MVGINICTLLYINYTSYTRLKNSENFSSELTENQRERDSSRSQRGKTNNYLLKKEKRGIASKAMTIILLKIGNN